LNSRQISELFSGAEWPRLGEVSFTDSQATCQATLTMYLTKNISWFAGHFPGQPVLPGVVQVHWAAKSAKTIFTDLQAISTISSLKFKTVILPETEIELTLCHNKEKASISFVYLQARQICSSGTLVFSS
jgi:3-hydroxymyristoyl/3-hydroxydecanoyl-(acyl carrier protein) dehydratase